MKKIEKAYSTFKNRISALMNNADTKTDFMMSNEADIKW